MLPTPPSRAGRRRVFSLAGSLLVVTAAGAAASAPAPPVESASPLELEWQSHDPGCDAENVTELVLSSLGTSTQPRHVAATAHVRRDGSDWVVQLDTRSSMHTGRRVLRSPSCADLRQALALLLAMIVESEAEPNSVELPAEAEGSAASEELRPVSDTATDERGVLLAIAQAGGSYGFGFQPETSWGFSGGAGLAWRSLEATVRFTHWPTTRAFVENSEGHIELTRNNVALALCGSLEPIDWLSVVPCLAPGVTFFDSHAVDTLAPLGKVKPLVGLNAMLDVRYWLPGQHVFLSVGSGVVWEKRQPFRIHRTCEDGAPPQCMAYDDTVYESPGIGGSFALAIGARF